MLVLAPIFGAPAFATSEDPNWRVAPSRDGIEDAISHDGRFYSLTYSGLVEAWDRDADTARGFKSTVIAPKLNIEASGDDGVNNNDKRRKYLAMAPDGRFMVVVQEPREVEVERYGKKWTCVFKVHLLGEACQHWNEVPDIGDAALFVGVNSTLCVSTKEHPRIRARCVYFTDDEISKASHPRDTYKSYRDADEELKWVGVYSFRDGRVDKLLDPEKHPRWLLPVWFTPSAV